MRMENEDKNHEENVKKIFVRKKEDKQLIK